MKRRKIGSVNRNCKERMNYLLRVFLRSDCFLVFYFKVNLELCFKFVFLFLFIVGFLFLFEIVLLVVLLEGGVVEVMFIVVGDEYFGVVVVLLLVVFWLLFCKWVLIVELWLVLVCIGIFGLDFVIVDCVINIYYSVCFCDSLREYIRKEC